LYRYDAYDQRFLEERVAQYRDQVRRRLAGQLSEEEFKPLRLMNGLYLQLHAYMLRVAIPYGTLAPEQMRMLAHVARRYDRGWGHFTTRTNCQFNWIKLEETPDILADLATVQLHAIQTSGNSFRNTTADPWAGAAADEIEDPRPYCEIIRQWSTLHPEFSFLPRKFKIAVSAAKAADRAAVKVHDIGLYIVRNEAGEVGFEVLVGGGLGRTPVIGATLRDFLPKRHLLSYLEAILRVYNQHGRRDNLYKSRIKILVQHLGIARMREAVEAEWAAMDNAALALSDETIADFARHFAPPDLPPAAEADAAFEAVLAGNKQFARWVEHNTARHKVPGHAIVTLSLKPYGRPPGDCTAEQMDLVADLADEYSQGEIRLTHEQNIVLPHVRRSDLWALWHRLEPAGLGTSNIGLVTDIIACPGLDYCSLATARSIPIAERLSRHLAAREDEIGELKIKISGCINACGHHHVGHIGILGVDKNGEEFYQITLGGSADQDAALGAIIGPAVSSAEVTNAIDQLIEVYLSQRAAGERFNDTYRRIGAAPFKAALYAARPAREPAYAA
jgi:sulfite reductase (NADPH) hemoprotein beta-component